MFYAGSTIVSKNSYVIGTYMEGNEKRQARFNRKS
jgi:hypothetical protein